MQFVKRSIGVAVLTGMFLANNGCDTTSGALTGGAVGAGLGVLADPRHGLRGALIGGAVGAVTGAIIGHINEEQRARLQQQSPQTWETIQHNDQVAAANPNAVNAAAAPTVVQPPQPAQPVYPGQPVPPPQPTPVQPPAPSSQTLTPLTVDDIKAMASSGIKSDVIIGEIQTSKTVYTAQDIATVQAAMPPIDPAVIDCMKKTTNG